MRYLVFSDSHNRHSNLETALEKVGEIDGVFCLGDVEDGLDYMEYLIDCPFYGVRGNCDYDRRLDEEMVVEVGNHKIFMTHGHLYFLSKGYDTLIKNAKANQCDVILHGHTHLPKVEEMDGVVIANPGSITNPRQFPRVPTYMIMELDRNGELHFTIVNLEE